MNFILIRDSGTGAPIMRGTLPGYGKIAYGSGRPGTGDAALVPVSGAGRVISCHVIACVDTPKDKSTV